MARTAVVAGVGPGLGESLARTFADEGCAVGLFARSGETIGRIARELEATGTAAVPVPTDVTDESDVTAGFETVREELGTVDILVLDILPALKDEDSRVLGYYGLQPTCSLGAKRPEVWLNR